MLRAILVHTKAPELMAIIIVIARTQRLCYESPFSVGLHLNSWAQHQLVPTTFSVHFTTLSTFPSSAGQPFCPFIPGELISFCIVQFKSINQSINQSINCFLAAPLNLPKAQQPLRLPSVSHRGMVLPPPWPWSHRVRVSYLVLLLTPPQHTELQTSRADSPSHNYPKCLAQCPWSRHSRNCMEFKLAVRWLCALYTLEFFNISMGTRILKKSKFQGPASEYPGFDVKL